MTEQLDVSGLDSDAAVAARLRAMISERGYGSETSLRVLLRGEVAPTLTLSTLAIEKMCTGGPEYLEVRDRTLPVLDSAYLERDMTLRGALFRELLPRLREGSEEERALAADALRAGLAAIDGRAILPDLAPGEVEE